jgi:hypothetical protein
VNNEDEQPFSPPRVCQRLGHSPEPGVLVPKGPLADVPLSSLARALTAIAEERATSKEAVFVICREIPGWVVYEFSTGSLGQVDLDEVLTVSLPLAADPTAPRTYLVDSHGRLGALLAQADAYVIVPLGLSAAGVLAPVAKREDAVLIDPTGDYSNTSEPALGPSIVTGFVVPEPVSFNHATNIHWKSPFAFRPGSSIQKLALGLAWMSSKLNPGISIRAVGSRHSWSPVMATDGVTVLPDDGAGLEAVSPANAQSGPLYRILAGTNIRQVNTALSELDLAIPYLGGFDGQTMGGVFATGTHGSVGSLGPLADLIRSIDLVTFDGPIIRIEPARLQVTDPATLQREHPEIELLTNDDRFDAVRLGLGAFGIIHSLILETVPKYWLQEIRTLTTLDEVRQLTQDGRIASLYEPSQYVLARLRNRDLADYVSPSPIPGFPGHPSPAFHLEFLWNPYQDGKMLVTTRHWVDAATRGQYEAAEPDDFERGPNRNLFRTIDPRTARFQRPGLSEFLALHAGESLIELLELIERVFPQEVPYLIDSSIESLANADGYVQRSYNVFNIGDGTNQLPSLSATMSVPLRADLWLTAIDIIRQTSEALLQRGVVESAPIALRFVAGSTALLADSEAVCKFEFIFGGNNERIQQKSSKLIAAHYQALRSKLGNDVHLHFGQLVPTGTLDQPDAKGKLPIELAFPRFGTWRNLRDELDPAGHGLSPWLRSILPAQN